MNVKNGNINVGKIITKSRISEQNSKTCIMLIVEKYEFLSSVIVDTTDSTVIFSIVSILSIVQGSFSSKKTVNC